MHSCPLRELTAGSLSALKDSFRTGVLSYGLSRSEVERLTGPASQHVLDYFRDLVEEGFQPKHIARVIDAVLADREGSFPLSHALDLVISGPDLPGVPMGDTAASMHTLVSTAMESVILVGYAVYHGKSIFKHLAVRMDEHPELDVKFLLNLPRPPGNTSDTGTVAREFLCDFKDKQWPGKRLPAIYYDPRSLESDPGKRASLHAKCVIIDRREALITSANFTDAAQSRNVEVGLCLKQAEMIDRLVAYFEALIAHKFLVKMLAC